MGTTFARLVAFRRRNVIPPPTTTCPLRHCGNSHGRSHFSGQEALLRPRGRHDGIAARQLHALKQYHTGKLRPSDVKRRLRRCGITREFLLKEPCPCCPSVDDPNRAAALHDRLEPTQPPLPKREMRQRYRGTSTFSHLHPTRADDNDHRMLAQSPLEQTGHTASKCRRNPFKNEHRRFSFVICRGLSPCHDFTPSAPRNRCLTKSFPRSRTRSMAADHRVIHSDRQVLGRLSSAALVQLLSRPTRH